MVNKGASERLLGNEGEEGSSAHLVLQTHLDNSPIRVANLDNDPRTNRIDSKQPTVERRPQ